MINHNPVIMQHIINVAHNNGLFKTAHQASSFELMKECYTHQAGGRVFVCPSCANALVLYNPCNQRGCPICSVSKKRAWRKKLQLKLLDTRHYHLTFTIPSFYTAFWHLKPTLLINVLFSTVARTLKDFSESLSLKTGYSLIFQSHGQALCYKPHMHVMLTAGGVDQDQNWVPIHNVPTSQLVITFQKYFLQEIGKRFPCSALMYKPCENEWRIFESSHRDLPCLVNYLSTAVHGSVISLRDMEIHPQDKQISFRYHSKRYTLDEKIFVERYLAHIPPANCTTIRHYGIYSGRRKQELEEIRKKHFFSSIIELEYTLLCPHCQEEMKLELAFNRGAFVNFYHFGYGQSPPEHKEYSKP